MKILVCAEVVAWCTDDPPLMDKIINHIIRHRRVWCFCHPVTDKETEYILSVLSLRQS